MAPTGYRNSSLTEDGHHALLALAMRLSDILGHRVGHSNTIRVAYQLSTIATDEQIRQAAQILDRQVDINELTRRLGLPADKAGAVGAWTGADWGTTWTLDEADELIALWNGTCEEHGVFRCLHCPNKS